MYDSLMKALLDEGIEIKKATIPAPLPISLVYALQVYTLGEIIVNYAGPLDALGARLTHHTGLGVLARTEEVLFFDKIEPLSARYQRVIVSQRPFYFLEKPRLKPLTLDSLK